MSSEYLFQTEAFILGILILLIGSLEFILTLQSKIKKVSEVFLSFEKDILLILYGLCWLAVSFQIFSTKNQIIKMLSASLLLIMIVLSKKQKYFKDTFMEWVIILVTVLAFGILIVF